MDSSGANRAERAKWWRSIRSYGGALLLAGSAFLCRKGLESNLKDYSCFLFFAPAAMLASGLGGLGSGLLGFVAGLLLGLYYFLEPIGSIRITGVVELVQVISYSVTTLVGIVLIEVVQRSRQAAQLAAQEAKRRNELLEEQIAERERVQQALQQVQDQLSLHSQNLEDLVAERTAKLAQTVLALEGFCYTVAHDLRSPLRAMEGFARALLEDYRSALDATGIDYAERICAAARRMDRLIQDLLAYEKLATLDSRGAPVPLEPILDRALTHLADDIRTKQAQVVIDKPLPSVVANASLLEQVIVHLLANALKFTSRDAKPAIRVSADKGAPNVRLWIQDNGIGIASEHQAKLFQPFTRLHGQAAYPGNGIGLAFVRRALERMGGAVGVDSILGRGSKFWIELPDC